MLRIPGLPRSWIMLLAMILVAGAPPAARAADPQPYTVKLDPTGDKALDAALHDSSSLIALKDKAPVGGFALLERARQDSGRFQAAVQSFGRYKARIAMT